MSVDIEAYNADWLRAWSEKDVERLLTFYAPDAVYKDVNTADGITGHEALSTYLNGLFPAVPRMIYSPDAVWAIEGGFCARWFCEVGEGKETTHLRGFDMVLLQSDLIKYNEVYVHQLGAVGS